VQESNFNGEKVFNNNNNNNNNKNKIKKNKKKGKRKAMSFFHSMDDGHIITEKNHFYCISHFLCLNVYSTHSINPNLLTIL